MHYPEMLPHFQRSNQEDGFPFLVEFPFEFPISFLNAMKYLRFPSLWYRGASSGPSIGLQHYAEERKFLRKPKLGFLCGFLSV